MDGETRRALRVNALIKHLETELPNLEGVDLEPARFVPGWWWERRNESKGEPARYYAWEPPAHKIRWAQSPTPDHGPMQRGEMITFLREKWLGEARQWVAAVLER